MEFGDGINKCMSVYWEYGDDTDKILDNRLDNYFIKNFKFIKYINLTGITYELYYGIDGLDDAIYLLVEGEIHFLFIFADNGNHILIREVIKRTGSKVYYSDFLKNIILPKYEFILSGISHTESSINAYKRFITDPEINVSVVDIDDLSKVISVSDATELEKFHGEDMENFRFRLSGVKS